MVPSAPFQRRSGGDSEIMNQGLIWKTAPQLQAPQAPEPPETVVPYRFPAASIIRAPIGPAPSVGGPLKSCSTLSIHRPLASGDNLKTTPAEPTEPPSAAVPYRFPALSKVRRA